MCNVLRLEEDVLVHIPIHSGHKTIVKHSDDDGPVCACAHHYENTPMQHTAIFDGSKKYNFHLKLFDYFQILLKT